MTDTLRDLLRRAADKTVEAAKPVAFIDATDDGAVYEACPTAHSGVVSTGDSGSLVVWGDVSGRQDKLPLEFVVFDTSRREEVARIPFTAPGRADSVLYVDEDHVYFNPDPSIPGCWAIDVNDLHPCKHRTCSGSTFRPVRPRGSRWPTGTPS
jgi:hypothetical protein